MRLAAWGARLACAAAALASVACAEQPAVENPAGREYEGQVYASELHSYTIETVVSGLAHPWGLAFLPDGRMLVTERPGRLRLVRNGRLDPTPIAGVPDVRNREQGGLLDVAIHPDFANNRLVYLSFSKPGLLGGTTAVVRGRLSGHELENVEEIFEARAWGFGTGHYGSRLLFDSVGHLFITVGERRAMEAAQDLRSHNGTHVRVNDDGSIPADNPFVGRADALPEIWSFGNRNPQGLAWHPETGELWSSEHGPQGGDEINVIRPGRNYGWPVITYGINYTGQPISDITHKEGMEQPMFYFLPSIGTSGLAFYAGDEFPAWRGDAFVGGLVGAQLARVSFRGVAPTYERLVTINRRIRDVKVGPDGLIYLLVDAPHAPILRLRRP